MSVAVAARPSSCARNSPFCSTLGWSAPHTPHVLAPLEQCSVHCGHVHPAVSPSVLSKYWSEGVFSVSYGVRCQVSSVVNFHLSQCVHIWVATLNNTHEWTLFLVPGMPQWTKVTADELCHPRHIIRVKVPTRLQKKEEGRWKKEVYDIPIGISSNSL